MTALKVALGLALVATMTLTARPARAQLDLVWDAPPMCPQREQVLARIRAVAGSSLDKTDGLSVEGKIERTNRRYWLTLRVRDGHEVRQRVIASDSCTHLAGAAAVALALLLGIELGATEPSPGTSDPTDPTPPTEGDRGGEPSDVAGDNRGNEQPKPSPEQDPTKAARPRPPTPADTTSPRQWAVLLRAPIAVADVGPLPNPTLGVGLGVGMRYESWRALLTGHLYREQTVTASELAGTFGAGAELQRVTGQLAICRGWRSARFEIAPCLGLTIEHVTAQGFGEGVSSRTQRAIWLAPSAGPVVQWYATKSLAIFAGISASLELSRPHIVVDGLGEIHQLGPAAAGASLGAEWIL